MADASRLRSSGNSANGMDCTRIAKIAIPNDRKKETGRPGREEGTGEMVSFKKVENSERTIEKPQK
jgi:hypothetical protein